MRLLKKLVTALSLPQDLPAVAASVSHLATSSPVMSTATRMAALLMIGGAIVGLIVGAIAAYRLAGRAT